MGMSAGRLRHRITIEQPVQAQDPVTGALATTWATVATVAASIEPLSVKDFIAAQAKQSQVSVRIVIRWRSGLSHAMRFVGTDGTIYKPAGFLVDPESGREYVTCPCTVEA